MPAVVVSDENIEQPYLLFQIQIKTEDDELWWYQKEALRPAHPRLAHFRLHPHANATTVSLPLAASFYAHAGHVNIKACVCVLSASATPGSVSCPFPCLCRFLPLCLCLYVFVRVRVGAPVCLCVCACISVCIFLCTRSSYLLARYNSLKEKLRREQERYELEMQQRELDEEQIQEIMVPSGLGKEGRVFIKGVFAPADSSLNTAHFNIMFSCVNGCIQVQVSHVLESSVYFADWAKV